ncbi:MAG: M6 family metalloprotease domain-containing protein [Bacteroidota bacterium]|nr:M6 family metalloprotease domain-containing protein [Bacteroidota bacterium]
MPSPSKVLAVIIASLACYFGGDLGPCSIQAQTLLRGPANPEPVVWVQPDGSQITVRLFGDEHGHFAETMDGYTVVRSADGAAWMYAERAADGQLRPAEMLAHEVALRTPEERQFLNGTGMHLRSDPPVPESELLRHKHSPDAQPSVLQRMLSEAQGYPVELNVPVLLVGFEDLKGTVPKTTVEAMMTQTGWNGGINSPGSFNDYLLEVSYGQVSISADVFGWYNDPESHLVYGDRHGTQQLHGLVWRAIEAADADGADFSKYDNDGDGRCDGLVVIHAGHGAAQYGDTRLIWPRAMSLQGSKEYDGVRFGRFGISSELAYGRQAGIGMHMHEFLHVYGELPDLYDLDGSSAGIGLWDIMSGGAWVGGGVAPPHLSAWSKKRIGWIKPNEVQTSGAYSFPAVEQDPSAIFQTALSLNSPLEYFLLEYRHQTGWDQLLPNSGLLIWHVDESRGDNRDETRKLVDLEEADGRDDLDHDRNRGDAGDMFPGSSSNLNFTHTSYPSTRSYVHPEAPSQVAIIDIASTGSSGSASIVQVGNALVDFLSDKQTGHVPLQVAFTNKSSGNEFTAWSWDFEGTGIVGSTEQSPKWTYEIPGYYSVKLSAQLTLENINDFWLSSTRDRYIRVFDGNSALFMDSEDAYGEIPSHASLDMTETMTIEAWVHPEKLNFSGSEMATILDKDSFSLHVQKSRVGPLQDNSFVLSIVDDLNQKSSWSTPSGSVEFDKWQHIAVVIDLGSFATPVRFLINGQRQSIAVRGNLSSALKGHTSKPARIGNRGDKTAAFEGTIDELRIWNTARTDTEINDFLNSRIIGDIRVLDGLVGYWPMNEGSGSAFKDESQHAIHGKTTGSWGAGAPVTQTRVDISANDVTRFEEIVVYPNYPNPFRISTTIPIHVPEPMAITVEVHNVLGQLVHTVMEDQVFPHGRHEIKMQPDHLANGVYMYSIRMKTALGVSQTIPGTMAILR